MVTHHSEMEPGPAHKRRRPAVACTECRRRKVRCDRNFPCGPCSKATPTLRCIYHDSSSGICPNTKETQPNNYFDNQMAVSAASFFNPVGVGGFALPPGILDDTDLFPLGFARMPDDPKHHSEFLELDPCALIGHMPIQSSSDLSSRMFPSSQSPPWGDLTTDSSFYSNSELGSVNNMSGLDSIRPNLSTSTSTSMSITSASDDALDMERLLRKEEQPFHQAFAECDKLRFLHDALLGQPGVENSSNLPAAADTVKPLLDSFIRLDRLTQKECESRASRFDLETKTLATPRLTRDALPPRSTCDALLEGYFNTFESVLTILHVPSFLRRYERYWCRSTTQWMAEDDDVFTIKLMLAMAIGSRMSNHVRTGRDWDRVHGIPSQDQINKWIIYAKQWLVRRMISGPRPDIEVVQIMALLALIRHTQHDTSYTPSCFWGDDDLARIAIHIGLHREPRRHAPKMPAEEAEMRRRFWATMLELSLQQCFDEGLPAPITPDCFDCDPPSGLPNENGPDGTHASPSLILAQLAQTQRLRLRILQFIHAPGPMRSYNKSCQLASQMHSACQKNLDMLSAKNELPMGDFQRKVLDFFTRPFILLALQGQHIDYEGIDKASSYYSRRMRMNTAAKLLDSSLQLPESQAANDRSVRSGVELIDMTHSGNSYQNTVPIANNPGSTSILNQDQRQSLFTTFLGVAPVTARAAAGMNDVFTSLRIYGGGHFALVQRQAATALCLDLISELQDDIFPTIDNISQRQLHRTLRDTINVFERRVRISRGAHSTREVLFFSCADAYIEALQDNCRPSEVDEIIAKAARVSFNLCCEAMECGRNVEFE